jgi:hypothetical protein
MFLKFIIHQIKIKSINHHHPSSKINISKNGGEKEEEEGISQPKSTKIQMDGLIGRGSFWQMPLLL